MQKIWVDLTIFMREFMPFLVVTSSLITGFGLAYECETVVIRRSIYLQLPLALFASVIAHPIADDWYGAGIGILFGLMAIPGAIGFDQLMRHPDTGFADQMLSIGIAGWLILFLQISVERFIRTARTHRI